MVGGAAPISLQQRQDGGVWAPAVPKVRQLPHVSLRPRLPAVSFLPQVLGCHLSTQAQRPSDRARPITDYNEVTLHFIQCVQMHIQNTKSKVGSPAHTNSSVGTPFSNSMSQAATPTFVKSNSISCAEVVSVAQGRRCFWLTRR